MACCIVLPWMLHIRSKNQARTLRISTGQSGGVYEPLGQGIAKVISAQHPKLQFEVTGSEGSLENIQRLERAECDLALIQNGTPSSEAIRIIAPLYLEVLHILVPADHTRYLTIKDLRGKRVAVGPKGSGTLQLVEPLFAHFGLDEDEFKPAYMDVGLACEALLNGEMDAVFVVAGIYAPTLRDTLATGKVRLLGIGRPGEVGGEVEGLRLHDPNVVPFIIPRYTYHNNDSLTPGHPLNPIQTIAVRSLLVSHTDLPPHVAKTLTQSIFENRTALTRIHISASQIKEPEDLSGYSYPLHLGAEHYFRRHDPGFLERYAEVIALIISLIVTGIGTLLAINKWIDRKQKDRIDKFLHRLDELQEKLNNQELDATELVEMERTLTGMRHDALRGLVREKIQADHAFQIYQTLLANTLAEVRAKQQLLPAVETTPDSSEA